jgi:signal peptidase I
VAFHRGRLLINGQPLAEPYASPCKWELAPVTVKADEYYVVGDNRTMRAADHEMGRVERWRLVGKILL